MANDEPRDLGSDLDSASVGGTPQTIYSEPFIFLPSRRLTEMPLWLIIAMIFWASAFMELALGRNLIGIFSAHSLEITFGAFTLLFPIIFGLIFGVWPFQALRLIFRRAAQARLDAQTTGIAFEDRTEEDTPQPTDRTGAWARQTGRGEQMLAQLASSSSEISKGIYRRAGVYLLIGVLVAFSGLAFFYGQTVNIDSSMAGITLLVAIAPKFGILFFIEIVAFFFLRQYRAAMDEFRYFEAIKRRREEVCALCKLVVDAGGTLDPISLVQGGAFFSAPTPLAEGQTTELLETRKLEKNEIALIEKLIDTFSARKA